MMPKLHRIIGVVLVMLFASPGAASQADMLVETSRGELLEVRVFGEGGQGPLFIWLSNQYGELARPNEIAAELAAQGAVVWQVDLLASMLLGRTSEAIRSIDGDPVAALLEAAVRGTQRPIVVVALDRMAAPALRGLRTWQEADGDVSGIAGAVLFFPNLYRGTPIAGEEPELLGIVGATNMPVLIVQPALGTNRMRLDALVDGFRQAGSSAYASIVSDVRDYYLLQSERPVSESFERMGGPVPQEVEHAIKQTPALLLSAARLLASGPRPARAVDVSLLEDEPVMPAFGVIERPRMLAPAYALRDARGGEHADTDNLGRVTLVNFWASWCPPCVHEIPSMNRLAGAYDAADFAIVSVNFKEDPTHILDFMTRVDVDFPVLMDRDGAVSAEWGVFAFPSSFILDHEGRIRYSINTAIEWDTDEIKAVIDRLRKEATSVAK